MMHAQKILKGGLLLAASSLASRLLGLLRDRLFAHTFGALAGRGTYDIDAYYAAFRVPDFMYQLIVAGVIASAFVPLFAQRYYNNEKEKAWRLFSATAAGLGIIIMIVCGLLFVAAPSMVRLLAPGFDVEKIQTTVHLTRILLITPVAFTLSSLFQSVENAGKSYTYFAVAPIVYNLSIIIATLIFGKTYGVFGIAWGVAIGSVLHALIQLPPVIRLGFRGQKPDSLFAHLKEFASLALPRIASLGMMQINLLVDTIIASTLQGGSLALLNYAINLQSLPLGLIGISVSIVAFGSFAHHAAQKDHEKLYEGLMKSVETILFFTLPAVFGMMMLKKEIVSAVLQTGKFGETDASLTAYTLGILSIGLLGQSLVPLLGRFFFAQKNTRTPLKTSAIACMVNLVGSVYFGKIAGWGILGLATGFSLANLAQACMLWWYIIREQKEKTSGIKNKKNIKGKMLRIIIASIAMTLIIAGGKMEVAYLAKDAMHVWLRLLLLVVLGGGSYFAVLAGTRYPNLRGMLKIRHNNQADINID